MSERIWKAGSVAGGFRLLVPLEQPDGSFRGMWAARCIVHGVAELDIPAHFLKRGCRECRATTRAGERAGSLTFLRRERGKASALVRCDCGLVFREVNWEHRVAREREGTPQTCRVCYLKKCFARRQPFLCRSCGTTEPERFRWSPEEPSMKSLCMSCARAGERNGYHSCGRAIRHDRIRHVRPGTPGPCKVLPCPCGDPNPAPAQQ